ncbi:adhesion G protein-coupled receptor F5-like [Stegostoma tigrinum]|uniref:adhesion G protein-coupled receptor F5-like n=1 Tax=Stegostoma tigrinum TaxID=3053191 RepID=UPI0028706601|nr:adhesion G protein-coupled receptor F5-like [Stegostoma tigrinum]
MSSQGDSLVLLDRVQMELAAKDEQQRIEVKKENKELKGVRVLNCTREGNCTILDRSTLKKDCKEYKDRFRMHIVKENLKTMHVMLLVTLAVYLLMPPLSSQVFMKIRPVRMNCSVKLKRNEHLPKSPVHCHNRSNTTVDDCQIMCSDTHCGLVESGKVVKKECPNNETGYMRMKCEEGNYVSEENFCVSAEVSSILESTRNKTELTKHLPEFVQQLASISMNGTITEPGNLATTVEILTAFSSISNVSVNLSVVQDFLVTVNAIIDQSALPSWKAVTNHSNFSSQLLLSVEQFTRLLSPTEETFNITKPNIQLKGMKIDSSSHKEYESNFSDFIFRNRSLTSSVRIDQNDLLMLPNGSLVISVAYATLIDILGLSNKDSNSTAKLNGLVVTTTAENSSINIKMVFSKLNNTFEPNSAECVYWDFSLNGKEGWCSMGCRTQTKGDNIVCQCKHLTSFSFLMSPHESEESMPLSVLSLITTGISVGCLIIGLIIEAVVWKHVTKTKISQARHITMLNIILSLLTANVLFITAGFLKPKTVICIVTIFLMNFFYLSLFFWMFTLALLLLYHLVFLFKDFRKTTIMIISFALGYLCPLIISISTFAVGFSQQHYIRKDKCWPNKERPYLYLLFIVPILSIIVMNSFITFLTIFKILRPTIGDKPKKSTKDTNVAKQICRSVAILSSVLGLTWALGFVFLKEDSPKIFNYAFDILSGLQGFCILIFGILTDGKVQDVLKQRLEQSPNSSQKMKLIASTTSNTY